MTAPTNRSTAEYYLPNDEVSHSAMIELGSSNPDPTYSKNATD